MTATLSPQDISSLLAGPAASPPPGVMPFAPNPPSTGSRDFGVGALALIVLTIAVALRLFTRWYLTKIYVIEDFLILAAWVLSAVHGGLLSMCAKLGMGKHMWDITLDNYLHAIRFSNIASIIYFFVVALIKVAILLQFIRTFAPNRHHNKWMFYACWTGIVVSLTFYLLNVFFIAALCTPWEKSWNPFVPGHCFTNLLDLAIAAGWFNSISDFIILLLPLPAIFKLQMKLKKKLAIAGLFTAGAAACVASVFRLYFTEIVSKHPDPSWHFAAQGLFSYWEETMGVLVFCLPTAPRFFRFVQTKIHSSWPSRNESDTPIIDHDVPERLSWANKLFGTPRNVQPESLEVTSVAHYLGPRRQTTHKHNFHVRLSSSETIANSNQDVLLDNIQQQPSHP